MILISTKAPENTAAFSDTLYSLLAGAIVVARDRIVASGAFPSLDSLSIDVSGASPVPNPAGELFEGSSGQVKQAVTVATFSVRGNPFGPSDRPVQLDVSARELKLEFIEAPNGRTALRLAGASDGKFRATIDLATVRRVFIAEVGKLAKAQGVDIRDAQIAWQTPDPRTLALEIQIEAKKGFFPATVLVHGRLAIDASLTARVSGLAVDGKGMGGTLGASLLRPRLSQFEGYTQSLLALPLDGIRIRDVRFIANSIQLSVEGEFGG